MDFLGFTSCWTSKTPSDNCHRGERRRENGSSSWLLSSCQSHVIFSGLVLQLQRKCQETSSPSTFSFIPSIQRRLQTMLKTARRLESWSCKSGSSTWSSWTDMLCFFFFLGGDFWFLGGEVVVSYPFVEQTMTILLTIAFQSLSTNLNGFQHASANNSRLQDKPES